jgi:predicted dithiol-disulfide oxidoreductase (DUF899 family)
MSTAAAAEAPLHDVRFPNESLEYRSARDTLLRAEMELRRQVEQVAALRRALPLGGRPPEDYAFDACDLSTGAKGRMRLSELFGDKPTLLAYSFMYGPTAERPCPMCTAMLDGLDGQSDHIRQRAELVMIAKSPIDRVVAFAEARGWRRFRLLSSAGTSYNADYHGEDAKGAQWPMLNVFARRDGEVRHAYATELFVAPADGGQDGRHVDMIWPLWNALDFTPEGRGSDWRPKLSYG